jgi:hypothetical protein
MKHKVNIESVFPKHLFWDMDYSKLDSSRDKDIIIPRAVFATTEETFERDIKRLESIYSKADIIKYLKETKERISNNVCKMVSQRYNVETFYRFKV